MLAEQIAYYRARAGEYDDWWYRRGRYILPPDLEHGWFADVAEAEAALHEFAPTGRVLELACGTGLWTRHMAARATHVTAVDASPEVIALNKARLDGASNVSYVNADLFSRRPYPPGVRADRTQPRELADGRTFTVIKRYWTPAELESDLQARGWTSSARWTGHGMILRATASPGSGLSWGGPVP